MKWKIENHCISQLEVDGRNLIFPWGIETADSSAFFSLEDEIGYRYDLLSQELDFSDTFCKESLVVKMQEGKWRLDLDDRIHSNNILSRKASLECLEDSHFMDFVMRFRFKKCYFPEAMISGMTYYHKNTNKYYQYPVREVKLGGAEYCMELNIADINYPSCMKPYLYVRDYNEEWVVHARMLPMTWNKEVIKLCNRWAKTRPLPQFLSKMLLKIPGVKRKLWYRGEKKEFQDPILRRINPLACPIVQLPRGEKLMWEVNVKIHKAINA